ncbi:MAG: 50S ribosomal protein L28 [Elusimicrobiota bacterium]
MAYKCRFCLKGPRAGKTVSHSNRHTTRVFNPNLFRRRVVIDGAAKRVYVCTSCLSARKTLVG